MARRKRATLTDLLNDLTFKVLYDKFMNLALSSFEWDGLPDDIEQKYIEHYLFNYGKCIFFRDPTKSYMALQADPSAKLNVYGEPLTWWATGHAYHKEYSTEKCVIIDNNVLRVPTKDLVMFYVNKLTEAERTMDVNIKAIKSPVVFACDDKDVLTFKRIFQQVDGNVPAIFADRGLNLDGIQVFDTKAKFYGVELMDYKKSVENELLTVLGFNNLPVDKKERAIVPEVNSNNQLIESFAELQLMAREKACEEINDMFGLSVSVKRKEVDKNVVEQPLRHNEPNNGTP